MYNTPAMMNTTANNNVITISNTGNSVYNNGLNSKVSTMNHSVRNHPLSNNDPVSTLPVNMGNTTGGIPATGGMPTTGGMSVMNTGNGLHKPVFMKQVPPNNNIGARQPTEMIEEFNRYLGNYAEDIHVIQKEDEEKHFKTRSWNCFKVQTEITPQMRSILVDWLIEVTEEYGLTLNTLFLTVNYVDRILDNVPIPRIKLQLLGVTCMLIASKFEEIHAPMVEDFVYITDNTYSRADILRIELFSLNALNFSLTVCTIKNFLPRFLLISEVNDFRVIQLANYLAEITLPEYEIHQHYKPSLIAASIVCLAKTSFNLPCLSAVFLTYCGYTTSDLLPCVRYIFTLHQRITQATTGEITSAREKYKLDKYGRVSVIPVSVPPTLL